MCPILGVGFAPISGNMCGRKRGEGRRCRPSPGLGARAFNGTSARTRVEPCMPQFALLGSLERWAICPMFARTGRPQGGPGAGQVCGLADSPNVAQQRCRLKVLDLALIKAKPRKVERCSVKNADSKFPMDRRFARIAGRRLQVAPRRRPRALLRLLHPRPARA